MFIVIIVMSKKIDLQ